VASNSSAYNRAYYLANRERIRAKYQANHQTNLEYQRQRRPVYRDELKRQVFEAYGNRCNCCDEDNPGFLSIDHVNGGGRKHRQLVGGSVMVLLDIIKRGYPDDFQILCFNCNLGRARNGGICPHKDAQGPRAADSEPAA
jgi:hypothetical protein